MVGFLHCTTIDGATKEENKEDIETQLLSDSKKPFLPNDPLDSSIPELEDLSDYFLDFNSFDGWLTEPNPGGPHMAELGGVSVDFNAVGGELGGSKVNLEVCVDGICKRDEVIDELAGKEVGLNLEIRVIESNAEICSQGVCENVNEKGALGGDEFIRDLGGLIEEKLGKVSLDGPLTKVDDEAESGSDVESESGSSSSSSSSSTSSSSSSSSSDDEDKGEKSGEKKNKGKGGVLDGHTDVEDGEIMSSDVDEMVTWDDDEEAYEDGGGTKPIKSKNELQDLPPVPPVNATLEPHHQTLPVGIILSIVETKVIVEGVEQHNPLKEGSILWITESRSPLGIIDEIFGPVKNPYYIVRYNSETEVPSGIQEGTLISFVQEFADHVLNDKSLYQKGYDASNENDEELSDDLEFSDDEKEAEYKRMLKMKKRGTNESKPGNNRREKRQQKNQKGNWNQNQNQDHKLPVITQNQQFNNPPVGTSSNQNQDNRAVVPPFPQGPQASGFSPPTGVWGIRFPHQQQQGNRPAGLPDGMMWMQPNLPYQLYQNPAFQQQIGMMPGLPLNFNAMGGLPNFGGGPSLMPWPTGQGQNAVNPLQFGMGFQGQRPLLPMIGGGPGGEQAQSQGSQNLNFNQGRGGGRGGGVGMGLQGQHPSPPMNSGGEQVQSQGSQNLNFYQGRGGVGMGLQVQHPSPPMNSGGEQVQSQGSQNLNFYQGRGGVGMGLQVQYPSLPMNSGGEQVQSQGSQNLNFNQGGGGGRGRGGGRRGHYRGRGRFSGGRGRQS